MITHNSPLAFHFLKRAQVQIKGRDAKSFLHRLSTNAVTTLQTGGSSLNALVNAKGRIIDLLHQVVISDDEVLIIGTRPNGSDLVEWLDQYLFAEQVTLKDVSDERAVFCLINPPSPLFQGLLPSLPFITDDNQPVPSYLFVGSKLDLDPHFQFIDQNTYETLRIAALIPDFPGEINEAFNPLELNLGAAIHWAKGCYIGQEVISRLESTQKITKQLRGMTCSEEEFKHLKVGNGVTSVAPLYWPNHFSALTVLKS